MIPSFKTLREMSDFFAALPKDANFSNMLKTDFGVDVPEDAAPYQVEYLWKYLVQGKYRAINEAELMAYATKGVEELVAKLPHLKQKGISPESVMLAEALDTMPGEAVEKVQYQPKAVTAPKAATAKPAKTAKPAAPKGAKATVQAAKAARGVKYEDGTVFYRADRNKWVAMLNGKQEAARPTQEACVKFLTKKGFPDDKIVVIDQG